MLSFVLNHQSLAQNIAPQQNNADKIKISAENPPIPSYLKHSKKAQELSEKQKEKQKNDTLWILIIKMLKALFLTIALFLGLVAIFFKNKDKFQGKTPIPSKQHEKIEPNTPTEDIQNTQPKIINTDNKIRNLVFDFFNMNK
jgi:hypothetical protein